MTERKAVMEPEEGIKLAIEEIHKMVSILKEIGIEQRDLPKRINEETLDSVLEKIIEANNHLIEANIHTSSIPLEAMMRATEVETMNYRRLTEDLEAKQKSLYSVTGQIYLNVMCKRQYDDQAAIARGSLKAAGIDPVKMNAKMEQIEKFMDMFRDGEGGCENGLN